MPSNKVVDMTGKRTGMLVVERQDGHDNFGQAIWLCRCDCGNLTRVRGGALRKNAVKSCGCIMKKARKNKFKISIHPTII